jgi:uncharacterized membrane-anchored protein
MKKPMLRILAVFILLQLLVPGYMVFRHYDTLITGEAYKFIVEPYDPYDPFRGRYVALSAEQNLYGDGRYAMLAQDAEGYAIISGWSEEKPRDGAYVTDISLDRYYMNEAMAPEAERLQRDLAETDRMYLLVKVKSGNYVIEGLYLNDVPIEQVLMEAMA